jgi:hypothetical protein
MMVSRHICAASLLSSRPVTSPKVTVVRIEAWPSHISAAQAGRGVDYSWPGVRFHRTFAMRFTASAGSKPIASAHSISSTTSTAFCPRSRLVT